MLSYQSVHVAEGRYVPYVNGGGTTIQAGTVVVQGQLVGVADNDIPAGRQGDLAVRGLRSFAKATGVGSGQPAGTKFYWDPVNLIATPVAGALPYIGKSTAVSQDADTTVTILFSADSGGLGSGLGSPTTGKRFVAGQATTATASDTIVTGLTTVLAAGASMDDAPVLTCDRAQASIGNQAGAPAAGSILLETFMPTGAALTTPVPATTFGKKVNWWAFGT